MLRSTAAMRVRCNCSSNLGLHSFAIDTDGALYGWGLNSAHQTGVGSAASDEPVLTPTRVRGLPAGESVAEVACGYAHSVVLMENGQVFAWGDNRFSQAGRPAATAPIAEIHEVVVEGERIASVACGYFFTVLVAESGAVYTFGGNEFLQLGFDSNGSESVATPTRVNLRAALVVARASEAASGGAVALEDTYEDAVVAVACGHSHTAALTSQGRVIVWGKNVNLQLGTGSLADCALPSVVSFFDQRFDRVTTLCCGAEFTLAATELGRLFGWGSNQYGVFGAHAHAPKYSLPVEIAFFRSEAHALVAGVACGAQHVLVLDDTGRVWAAGFNADGQLGVPNQKEYAGFQEVPLRRGSGDSRPVAVFCGREHSGCALDDGSVWVWGFNGAGELGLGTRVNVFEPIRVKLPSAVQRFAGYVCSVWEDDTTTRNAVRRQAMYLQEQWTRFDELRLLFSVDAVAVAREKAQRLLAATQVEGDAAHTAAAVAPTATKRKAKRHNTLTSSDIPDVTSSTSPEVTAATNEKPKSNHGSLRESHHHHNKTASEKCPKCAHKLKAGSLFCVHCGYKVVSPLAASTGAIPDEPNGSATAAAAVNEEVTTPPPRTASLSAPMPRMSALQKSLLELSSPAPLRQDSASPDEDKRKNKK